MPIQSRQRPTLPLESVSEVVLKCRDSKASIVEALLIDLPSNFNVRWHVKPAEGAIFRTLCYLRRKYRLPSSEIAVPIRPHVGELPFVIDLKSCRHG